MSCCSCSDPQGIAQKLEMTPKFNVNADAGSMAVRMPLGGVPCICKAELLALGRVKPNPAGVMATGGMEIGSPTLGKLAVLVT